MAQARLWLGKSAAQGNDFARRTLDYVAEVDRRFVGRAQAATGTGPTIADQMMETHRRQYRENCAAALKGASRQCHIP
jgi:hypothetical protein